LKPDSVTRFAIRRIESASAITIEVVGDAIRDNVASIVPQMADAVYIGKDVSIDLSGATTIDSRFFGLLIMLRKVLKARGKQLRIDASAPYIRRLFRLNNFEFLLESN